MNRFTLALGSNLGEPVEQLGRALGELNSLGRVVEVAPVFETPPLLPPKAPPEWYRFFANSAVILETALSAAELLIRTQDIEKRLGRVAAREKWSPRPLDIDILWTDPVHELTTDRLRLPHPEWSKRSFVLAPLLHLSPPAGLSENILTLARATKNLPPALMAVLNVTPDSFSHAEGDADFESQLAQFDSLLARHPAFVDVGAESTRPGATPISPEEEWSRLAPVLEHWKNVRARFPFTRLSLDTYHPETARRALDYDVAVLNDVSHLQSPAMRELVPHFEAVVLMHSLTVPADRHVTWATSTDVIAELKNWFTARMDTLHLDSQRVIFDPGVGFGKTPLQSLEILQRFDELDLPVRRLVGHSRKSFMTSWVNTPSAERDVETLGASLVLAAKNVEILRVHNLDWHQRALRAQSAIGAPP